VTAGAHLRKAGIEKISIVDQAGGIGGTWYWNRYPGVMCDVESYIYLPMLEELGYEVVEAASAGEALKALASGAQIDLVFTDVIMASGQNGIELARDIGSLRPDLPVLLTSGYTAQRLAPTAMWAIAAKPTATAAALARGGLGRRLPTADSGGVLPMAMTNPP